MSAISQEVCGPNRGRLQVKQGELFFECVGKGEPICFLHGFGLDSRMWTPQLDAFKAEFHVIRYDLRGFGRSSEPPKDEYTHEDDLKALLLHLGVKSAHIVGLSMGGRMALRFAAAYPEMVRSLTLATTALDGHSWSSEWQSRWKAMCECAKAGRLAEAQRLWREHPLFASARPIPSCASLLSAMVNEYSGWHWRERDTAKAPSPPLAEELQKITAPSLVITGSLDLPDFQAMGKLVAARIPRARSKRIEGSGHMVNLEAPDRFNKTLLEFWRELSE
ncbi:MAG TPA: alpha/beta hydrolase [Acidobacteriaceae bacterium]|nr:alpha/beta hydrolase [Acidobacteriaceae bacterium]